MKKIFGLAWLLSMSALAIKAQEPKYCLGYDVVSVIGTEAVIQLKLQGTSAFNLGSSNLRFNYNSSSMSNPVLEPIAPSNSVLTTPSPYTVINITVVPPSTRFNIELSSPFTGVPIAVSPAWTNIGRIKYTVMGANPTTALSFNPIITRVFKDNETTELVVGDGCPSLNVPLPIEIIGFDATKGKSNTLLTWKTVNALQMSHFDVERSKDGKTFEPIGQAVKAVNTIDQMTYKLTDEHPIEGINYYRLKSVETTGKVVYSKVISILFGGNFISKAYPNPFNDILTLDVTTDKAGSDMRFELINALGKVVAVQQRKATGGTVSITFNTLNLTIGSYILRIKDADKVWQEKFIKQ
jgi:Secretion system C-terminal sorting domain